MLRLLCAALILCGLGLFAYRALVLEFPLSPGNSTPVWAFEIQADIEPSPDGAKVSVFVPPAQGRYAPLRERFLSDTMTLNMQTGPDGNRLAIWSTADLADRTSVYYRARVFREPLLRDGRPQDLGPGDMPGGFEFVSERSLEQNTLASRIIADLEGQAFDDATLAALLINALREGSDDFARQIMDGRIGTTPVAETAAYILVRHGRFARAVRGIDLQDLTQSTVTPIAWLELWTGDAWESFDIATGDPFNPEDRMTIWRGDRDLVDVDGSIASQVRVAVVRRDVGTLQALAQRQEDASRPLMLATLLDLPVNTQVVLQTLLVLPLGVLMLVFMRQFIGVPTFGTFMPVLIALAFRTTSLTAGLIVLGIILAVGMTFRLFFSKLNLLLVPRLAAMLTVVIMVIILLSVLADSYALGQGFSITLFPIVILTMTIERLSVTWEENGPVDASKEFVGSIFVAVLSYLVMAVPLAQHLMFVFPELLLVVLAVLLMMGRYAGFRLSELRRFHELRKG